MLQPTIEQFVAPIRNERIMYALVFANNSVPTYLESFSRYGIEPHCRKHGVWTKPMQSAEILMLNNGDALVKLYTEG